MGQIDLRMTPEEKGRQQMDAIFSRCGWTVQDKSQMNLHAVESTALRQLTEHERIVAEVDHFERVRHIKHVGFSARQGFFQFQRAIHPAKVAAENDNLCFFLAYGAATLRRRAIDEARPWDNIPHRADANDFGCRLAGGVAVLIIKPSWICKRKTSNTRLPPR